MSELNTVIQSTPNLVGIIGYSLGAEVVTRFLEAQSQGEYTACEIAFAACVANPLRAPAESIDPNPQGYGLAGAHGPVSVPILEAANPNDGITSCPAGSPLRTLADVLSSFSFATLGGWTQALINELVTKAFQPANFIGPNAAATIALYTNAATLVAGYLYGGQHYAAYLAGGYTQRLAAAINALPI